MLIMIGNSVTGEDSVCAVCVAVGGREGGGSDDALCMRKSSVDNFTLLYPRL